MHRRGIGIAGWVASALLLAGCAATTGTNAPPPVNRLEYGSAVSESYDPLTNDATLTANGNTVTITYQASSGTIEAYFDYGGAAPLDFSRIMVRAIPSSGLGASAVFWSDNSNGKLAGSFVTTTAPGPMPATGNATFSGKYTGLRVGIGSHDLRETISGAATLNIDFAGTSLSGTITNRTGFNLYDDITLLPATLNTDGSFAGITSGGRRNDNPFYTALDGNYAGFVLGNGSQGAVGMLTFQHAVLLNPPSSVEYGAFYAE